MALMALMTLRMTLMMASMVSLILRTYSYIWVVWMPEEEKEKRGGILTLTQSRVTYEVR